MDDFKPRTTTTSPEPESPEESPNESASAATSTEEVEAILEIDLGDDTAPGDDAPSQAAPGLTADGLLTRDAFFEAARGCLSLAGQLSKLESLPVAEGEEAGARAAADALYDTALDVPWLRFLVEPGNVWMQRGLVVFAFAAPKAIAVRAEVAARKAASARPKPGAANDNGGQLGEAAPAAANDNADPLAGFPKDAPGDAS